MDSKLRCRYYSGRHALFRLQPAKLEEANLKPYIVVFHDVIKDRDINDLMAYAVPRVSSIPFDVEMQVALASPS